ncbi:hypothetical protein [Clostridium bowmanii]|nr:hypothetical protein [Clostridium bowmanii]
MPKLLFAAARAKYGSITAAFMLKRSFNPARIGLKVLTSPPPLRL